jgi:hypothetical protein
LATNVATNPGVASAGVQQQTGQKVRTLEVTILQGDGTTATVEMQVVSVGYGAGNVLLAEDFSGQEVQVRILRMLRRIAGALEQGMELGQNMAAETESDDEEGEAA